MRADRTLAWWPAQGVRVGRWTPNGGPGSGCVQTCTCLTVGARAAAAAGIGLLAFRVLSFAWVGRVCVGEALVTELCRSFVHSHKTAPVHAAIGPRVLLSSGALVRSGLVSLRGKCKRS